MSSTAPKFETVVFDVGGVLVDGDYRLLIRKLFATEAEAEFFLAEVLGEEYHLERDRGVLMADLAAQWSVRYPEYEAVIHEFNDRFPEMWRGPVAGSPEVLADLEAAGVPVYGLTNWGSETWVSARAQFSFLDSFNGVLVSADVGLIKPDPAIFRMFCERFAITPERSVYIDDVERNVAAAHALGFYGIVFADSARDSARSSGTVVSSREIIRAGLTGDAESRYGVAVTDTARAKSAEVSLAA